MTGGNLRGRGWIYRNHTDPWQN
uniref:Uncharacterized protein n=1 Tax=Anguilla anguilla TaxID=7936 RepID=A0A0E9QFZ5_ANGAN